MNRENKIKSTVNDLDTIPLKPQATPIVETHI